MLLVERIDELLSRINDPVSSNRPSMFEWLAVMQAARSALEDFPRGQYEYGVAMFGDMQDIEHNYKEPFRTEQAASSVLDPSFNDAYVRRVTYSPGAWERYERKEDD